MKKFVTLVLALAMLVSMFTLPAMAADEILQECGMPREKRKTVIDQVAAGLILQDFMENTKKGSQIADSESDTEEKNNNKNLEVMNSTAD